ncbi:MAG: HlyD family efflux transporter periplasmic adaptor subunit [Bacteroidales bacterium]|nr:HlyD family efflux transporter periplasmic adaptor subunit [Bacteroidales bacterium]
MVGQSHDRSSRFIRAESISRDQRVDISKIKPGQKAEIKLDAFSDTAFTGKVNFIASLAKYKKNDSKVKIFPVEVLVEGTSKKLIPGMSVSCKIKVDKVTDILYIPIEALMKDETKEYVYLKKNNAFTKQEIVTGLANNDYIIVEKGLDNKDEVALTDPFKK